MGDEESNLADPGLAWLPVVKEEVPSDLSKIWFVEGVRSRSGASPRSDRLAGRTQGRKLNMTEPDAPELDDPIERADDEFDRLKEEAEQRADRTAEVERELDGDEETS
jgi:hypothetical protein